MENIKNEIKRPSKKTYREWYREVLSESQKARFDEKGDCLFNILGFFNCRDGNYSCTFEKRDITQNKSCWDEPLGFFNNEIEKVFELKKELAK
ncbi:MAG: hypothetical protein ACRCU3_08435 [Eubacteriaceae bacterium]